jgi:hypothetical protein
VDLTEDCDVCQVSSKQYKFIGPIEREGADGAKIYVLEFAPDGGESTKFTCTAEDAGRITGLSLGDDDLLVSAQTANETGYEGLYGSSFWVSPQAVWSWPPPASYDKDAYSVAVDEDDISVELTGPTDSTYGLRLVKRFTLDLVRGAVRLTYSIVRDDGSATGAAIAPWEITRVGPGGITFFPTDVGATSTAGGGFPPVPTTTAANATWFAHDPSTVDSGGERTLTAGCRGWIGHGFPLGGSGSDENAVRRHRVMRRVRPRPLLSCMPYKTTKR